MDHENKLKEIKELTNFANKDTDRIEQQILTLKESSKQEAKLFEGKLKEIFVASEKKKVMLESQSGIKERKTGNFGNTSELNKGPVDSRFTVNQSTFKTSCFEDKGFFKQTSEVKKKQEEDFRKLVSATGIEDVSQLIENFIEMEEDNFKEFRFINELNFEIHDLEGQVAHLKSDRNDLAVEVSRNTDSQLVQKRKTENEKKLLGDQREKISQMNEDTERKLKDTLKEFSNLFYLIGADNLLEKNVLKNDFMRIENFPEILRTVDSRFLEIIYAYSSILSNVF